MRLGLDLPGTPGDLSTVHATPHLVLWDWLVAEMGIGTGLGQTKQALSQGSVRWRSSRAALLGRLRVGSGPQSVAFDLGPSWSSYRSLTADIQSDQVGFVTRQEEGHLGMAGQVNWRGWSLGVSWDQADSSWAFSAGIQALSNVLLF